MSESQYVEQKVRAFQMKHPAKAGWFVCRITYMMGSNYLPALLRLRKIEAQAEIWNRVSLHDGPRGTTVNFQEHPCVRRGPGLSDEDWFGKIRFRWRESLVVIERHKLEAAGLAEQDLTLVATRDRSAIEDLGKALLEFCRRSMKSERSVLILNGGGVVPLPTLGWGDLILPAAMVAEIRSNVEAFLTARTHYHKLGLPFRRGFLFVGPPGGGKTTAAKIILANAKARPLALSLQGDIKDSTIECAFREAASAPPAILLIEDLDKMVSTKNVSMAHLLNLLDGLDTYEGFLLIATSNDPEKIDKALLHRPSRFDRVWQFGLPGLEERRHLLDLRGQGKFSDVAIDAAAQVSAGMTMAYVQEVVVSAMLHALHEGRQPVDADLASMAKRLQEQCRSSKKVTGAIPEAQSVGFVGNGLHAPGEDHAI